MSQQYASAPLVSTPEEKEMAFTTDLSEREGFEPAEKVRGIEQVCVEKDTEDMRRVMEEHQQLYTENQEKLLTAIDSTSEIVTQLRQFSKDRWVIHYPEVTTSEIPGTVAAPSHSLEESDVTKEQVVAPPAFQRSLTYQPKPSSQNARPTLRRQPLRSETTRDMSVLKLELKVGPASRSMSALMHSLEKSSIAQLLDGRFASSLTQLDHLRKRVSDKQSKVLITGDLNAGKSTYVNALLRRKVMPTDQQPCTTVFCEVLDAEEGNEGRETVHMLKKGVSYDIHDDATYSEFTLEDIEQIVTDAEELDAEDAPVIKCYCNDTRATQESLLRNGVVDISLIDAPGLNTDSVKTTNLFARQDEIDVVVFVVSAENHFTLSAKEFLWNASNDKAYVFIVVNKYDQIRNKERCRQRVLEQIRQLSPRTYEDAENLVHFVDSSAVMQSSEEEDVKESSMMQPFNQMEAALRDFVLHKRSISKLQPAQTYLLKVLFDVAFLSRTNISVANRERKEAKEALALARPALQKVQSSANKLETQLEGEEDGVVGGIVDGAKSRLEEAIERVSKGEPAEVSTSLPEYPGLFAVWDYARDVRETLLHSVELAVRSVEDLARDCTKDAVDKIRLLGEKHLPDDVEKSNRVFLPEAMFAKRRSRTAFAGLGLGAELVEVKISDIFDVRHHFMLITGSDNDGKAAKEQDEETSMVNSLSLGLGALTLVGGKAFGAKTAVDIFVRVSDLVGNPTARRWALPVFVVASTGLIAWTIIDLPNSIPRNVGRSLAKELRQSSSAVVADKADGQQSLALSTVTYSFTEIQSRRISRDSRKVLRLAGYDLSERFRVAINARKHEVAEQEQKEQKAQTAMTWFESTGKRVSVIQKELDILKGISA
ncbi:hypothetical protein CBS101457_002745 [Exobasidium rhododendri]|nr:hypothetical protein CBS101457_002745 [Exobasidium rhododendri]